MMKRGPNSSPFSKIPDRFERLPVERLCEEERLGAGVPGGVFVAEAARLEGVDLAGLLDVEEGRSPASVPGSGESMVRSSDAMVSGTPQ